MIYALLISSVFFILFLVLYIRSVIFNGILRNTIKELTKDVEIKQKQLEISSAVPATPDDLTKRMLDGTL